MRGASPSAITMCQISRRMYNATFMTHTVEMHRKLHDCVRATLHDRLPPPEWCKIQDGASKAGGTIVADHSSN